MSDVFVEWIASIILILLFIGLLGIIVSIIKDMFK